MSALLIPKNNKRGSFLVEVLLAVVILSVSLTLIIQSMTTSLRASQYVRGYTLALGFLENELFDLKQQKTIDAGTRTERNLAQPYEAYRYVMESRSAPEDGGGILNEVRAEIIWASGRRTNKLGVTTYLLGEKDDQN